MKRLFSIALILTLSLVLLGACSDKEGAEETTDTQIYTVQKGNIANQITATGYLKMPNQAKLTFGASGTVDEILVDIGDKVTAGQVLSKLDEVTVSSLKQSLLQAQVDVKTAQMNLDNARQATTSASGATVSAPDPLDIEAKELALERAKMKQDSAQKELDGSVIKAPWDGWVAEVNSLVGDRVGTSTVVMRLIDTSIMTVDTLVNETDIFNVDLGAPATVTVVALSNMVLPATVTNISPSATISGGVVNYTVRLKVTNPAPGSRQGLSGGGVFPPAGSTPPNFSGSGNDGTSNTRPDFPASSSNRTGLPPRLNPPSASLPVQSNNVPLLKEGLSVNITLIISEKKDVLVIPSRAITRKGTNAFVQLYVDEKTTQERAVKMGISDWQNTEVTEGLSEGEKIVITRSLTSSTSTTQQNSRQPMGGIPMGPPPGFR